MKIVIAGALGHIGSKLIRELPQELSQKNSGIVMIDNLSTQRYASLFNLNPQTAKYEFLEMDILTGEVESLIRGADVVIHLAALTEAMGSAKDPDLYERVNYKITEKLANACAKLNVPLIFPSTCSVYSTNKSKIDEDAGGEDLNAQSPYSRVKLKEEELLQKLGTTQNLKYTICRLGTISGTSQGMRFHTAVNSFCWKAVLKKPLQVWETALNQKRPYLTLTDCMRAFAHIVENKIYTNQIYNILNENTTVAQIVDTMKKEIPDLKIDMVKSDIMNSLSYEVSNSKFILTGFKYTYSLDRSIRDTLDIFKALK